MKRVRADQEAQRSLAALIRKIFEKKICPKMDAPPEPTPEKLKNRILFEITGRSNDDFSLGPQFRVSIKKEYTFDSKDHLFSIQKTLYIQEQSSFDYLDCSV